MSKVKKDTIVDEVIEIQHVSTVQPLVVTALDPVYNDRGQLSYGFTVELGNKTFSFRTNQQGYLQFNNSGSFYTKIALNN